MKACPQFVFNSSNEANGMETIVDLFLVVFTQKLVFAKEIYFFLIRTSLMCCEPDITEDKKFSVFKNRLIDDKSDQYMSTHSLEFGNQSVLD